jgi:Zn-dependent protease with chaperone function
MNSNGSFAGQWNYNPLRYRFGITATNTLNLAGMGAAAAYSLTHGHELAFAFSVAAAGATQLFKTPVLREVLHRHLILPHSEPPSPALQDQVGHYMRRAGIEDFEIRVMNMPVGNKETDKEKRTRVMMNCGAGILSAKNSGFHKPTLLIGRDTLNILNEHELNAVLCHEISHVKNANSPKGNSAINFGITANMLLTVTTYLIDPVAGAITGAAWIGGKILRASAGQFDEHRADYNSAGQYPHPTALTDSLKKISGEMRRQIGMTKPPSQFTYVMNRVANTLFDEHPSLRRRENAHGKRIPEVLKFYEERKIPLPFSQP